MKLSAASLLTVTESLFIRPLPVLKEDGEGPKWDFNYDNWQNDPTPSILVLGAYRHPNTGNNLVGGINLNYLSKQDRDGLARILPRLMKASDLYNRYHLGAQLMPGVFENFYRTYNAAHIRGVTADVFYPKYGMMKATADLLKKKIGGLFKSREQRAADAQPKYPEDLSNMKDTLDQTVAQLGLQVGQMSPEEEETPEMQAARKNFQKFQADRAKSLMDIDRQEDEPFIQANNQLQATQLQRGQATPQQVSPQAVAQAQQAQTNQPPLIQPQQPQPQQPQPQPQTPQQMGNAIAKERTQHQQELLDPNNSLDLDGDGLPDDQQPATESIMVYYDQTLKQYIMEDIDEVINCM